MADIFGFIQDLIQPGAKQTAINNARINKRLDDEASLRSIKVEDARRAQEQTAQSAQEARFQNIIDNPDSTQQARTLAGQALSNLPRLREITQQAQGQQTGIRGQAVADAARPELFSALRGGTEPQEAFEAISETAAGPTGQRLQEFIDEPVSLFDFSRPEAKTFAQQRASAVAGLSEEDKAKVLTPELTVKPVTAKASIDEVQSIQKSFSNGEITESAAKEQIALAVGANPEAFKNANVDTLTELPAVKLAATVGGVDPAFLEKTVKTEVEKDIKSSIESVSSLVGILENFDRDFLTTQGKFKAKLNKMADIFDKPDLFGGREFANRQTAFISQAKTAFLTLRKHFTGVAGGIKELEQIAKSFPDADPDFFKGDTPDQFKTKALGSIKSSMKAINLLTLMRNEGLEVTQANVTEQIRRLPIGNVPLEIPQGATVSDILGNQTVQESLATRINAIKIAEKDGKATVANTPDANTAPTDLISKVKLDRIAKAVRASDGINVNEFMKTHPSSMAAISQLLDNEDADDGDVAGILKMIRDRGMSDEEFVNEVNKGNR